MLTPVTPFGDRKARITSPYGQRRGNKIHRGQDWLFDRLAIDPEYHPTNPRGSKGFYVPPGATARSVLPGRVRYANKQDSGYVVRVTYDTFEALYLHLRSLHVYSGEYVSEGQSLGEIGGDPRKGRGKPYGEDPFFPGSVYGVCHCHFECRYFNNQPFDPRKLGEMQDGNGGTYNSGLVGALGDMADMLYADFDGVISNPDNLAIAGIALISTSLLLSARS